MEQFSLSHLCFDDTRKALTLSKTMWKQLKLISNKSRSMLLCWKQSRRKYTKNSFYNLQNNIMEILLIGFAVNVLTWVATKFKLSWTYVALILSLAGGAVYYLATNYYPDELKQVLIVLAWIYATSQTIYNLLKKLWILEKIK